MPDPDQAEQLQELRIRAAPGTSPNCPASAAGNGFSGRYYRSARDDTTVVNVQAEPVGRARAASMLAQLAADTAAL